MTPRGKGILVVLLAVLTGAVVRVVFTAPATQYVETFRSLQYRDDTHTTALWDTSAGQIGLPAYQPVLLGAEAAGDVRGLGQAGYLAVAADVGGNAFVLDVSDPASPLVVGAHTTGAAPLDAEVVGTLVYLAAATGGLRLLDISNPAAPVEVGAYATSNARGVSASGRMAYVADFSDGVVAIDAADPSLPTLAGSYATAGPCLGIALTGDYLYAATGSSGVLVLDVSDPSSPDSVGSESSLSVAQAITTSGDLAYVANGQNGMALLDISDRSAPTVAGVFQTPSFAGDVAVSGRYAFISVINAGIVVVDASDPAAPEFVAGLDTQGLVYEAAVEGPYAYLADGFGGFKSLRVGSELAPLAGGAVDTPDTAVSVEVAGRYAYVADGSSGLRVVDVSDPAFPVQRGVHDTPGRAHDVSVCGVYAYVADGPAGVRIVDVTNPDAPELAASVNTTGTARGVAVSGNYVYVADGTAGLRSIEVLDPRVPSLVGGYDTPGDAGGVAASGTLAYVLDGGAGTSGLRVVDTSAPDDPVPVGDLSLTGEAVAFDVYGVHAFVLNSTPMLLCVDLVDATSPAIVGALPLSVPATGIAVSGGRAFVTAGGAGLVVVDVTDPARPVEVASHSVLSDGRGAAVGGEYLFAADGAFGLRSLQVWNYALDIEGNAARSTTIHSATGDVVSVKLAASAADSIRWEVSADGGAAWDVVAPDGYWHPLSSPGGDLRWRSSHFYTETGVNPACDSLAISWLAAAAAIDSVRDVPDDAGGWVRLFVTRSGYDVSGAGPLQVTQYVIHRRVDEATVPGPAGSNPRDNRAFSATRAAGFPPGTWEVVGYIPALQQDGYIALAPTLADSVDETSYTVFVVSAHTSTPETYFVSAPDSGYSVDNSVDRTPPSPPSGFTAYHIDGAGNRLRWSANTEPDFLHYRVYRDTIAGFDLGPSTLIYQTFDTTWTDPVPGLRPQYYKLTAVDTEFNESGPAETMVATGAVSAAAPRRAWLYQNFPNPFNPATTIRFDVPAPGARVYLAVYDAAGRLVRTLVDDYREAGSWTVVWEGRNDHGVPAASGVYLCRLVTGGAARAVKMALVQ